MQIPALISKLQPLLGIPVAKLIEETSPVTVG